MATHMNRPESNKRCADSGLLKDLAGRVVFAESRSALTVAGDLNI